MESHEDVLVKNINKTKIIGFVLGIFYPSKIEMFVKPYNLSDCYVGTTFAINNDSGGANG